MDVWADIGGFPPPRQQRKCESTVNSGMQVEAAVDAAVKAEATEPAVDTVGDLVGPATSTCNLRRRWMRLRGLGVSRGAKAEGDSLWPELGVGKEASEPCVKRELKEAMGPLGVVAVKRQGKAKLAAATAGGKRWYCGACGKYISCSNRAKHVKRIHPRAITVKRGRPKGDGKRIRRKGTRLERDACEGTDVS